jgi:hypothetical protein
VIFVAAHLRDFLVKDLFLRKARHPGFSLRAYARFLGLNPTSLSLFLNGHRALAPSSLRRIAERLRPEAGLPDTSFMGAGAKPDSAFTPLDVDKLHVLGDWYYFAILSIMETHEYRDDPPWIARRLGLSVRNVTVALRRLEKLDLIARDGDGRRVATGKSFSSPDQVVHMGVRKSHFQALDLARDSLGRDCIELRNFSAMTMAIDPARLPEATRRIQKFRRRLCAYLEGGTRREVYRLSIQLFPLSTGQRP